MKIPQTSPRLAYLAQREEIDAAVASVLDSERYILGAEVSAFEAEFAAFVGVRNGIGVANGTDALHLALRAVGVEPGDIVVTVANTAVATAAAIEMAGARVAFVDVDDDTLTMSAHALDAFLRATTEGRVRAVVPVHLYGRPANMPELVKVARQHGLAIVEDCAQAHGARFEGQTAGTFGDIAAFSFYPTKNLGAIGDGGAVLTNDAALADQVRLLRQYGWRERDSSIAPGFNSRLDELQAAILRVKLRRLANDNERRRAIAARYDALAGVIRTPPRDEGHVYHQYVVRTPERDALRDQLQSEEITTLVHYPTPIHQQPAYEGRVIVARDGLPVTEHAAHEILSLPMFPQLSDAEVARVCAVMANFARV